MKNKAQKTKELKLGQDLLAKNQTVIFADFTGVGTASINKLKKELKKSNSVFKVIKKRLLKIAFKEQGLDFDPTQFDAQVGAVFIPGELSSTAGAVYKFTRELAKEKKEFKVLGVYEIPKRSFLDQKAFLEIAKLPSREVLLAQVVGVLAGPIRAFMHVLNERAKKMVEQH